MSAPDMRRYHTITLCLIGFAFGIAISPLINVGLVHDLWPDLP